MKVFLKRPKDLGLLFVVGGPGGSGSSTIAKMLARHYGLHYVYGGMLMRRMARNAGFETLEKFLEDLKTETEKYKADKKIDKKLIRMSYYPHVLIDSKIFAGLAVNLQIPCSVRIWLTSSIETRVRRTLHKEGKHDLNKELSKKSKLYRDTSNRLLTRHSNDKNRYWKLYDVKYDKPAKYNDIVVDSSGQTPLQTFNFIVKMVDDGEYIERE